MVARTYKYREEQLAKLGFKCYEDYLRSDLWKKIRKATFSKHGGRCSICNERAQVLHHLSYALDVLLGKDLSQLVPICNKCHTNVERRRDGTKRSFAESQNTYMRLSTTTVKVPISLCDRCGGKAAKEQRWCGPCAKFVRQLNTDNPGTIKAGVPFPDEYKIADHLPKYSVEIPSGPVIIMTYELLHSLTFIKGKWSVERLGVLGFSIGRKGWIEKIVGEEIPRERVERLI